MIESASAPTTPQTNNEAAHAELMRSESGIRPAPERRYRWWIDYGIGGDLRFLSHHDVLRLFRRAAARAEIPVRFTEGFNPHPKIMFPLPRALGISSDAEAVVLETAEAIEAAELLTRLRAQMPPGVTLHRARRLEPGARPQPDTVTYRFRPDAPLPDDAPDRIRRILEAETLPIERLDHKTNRTRTVDIRPYLLHLNVEGGDLVFTLRVTGAGSARPHEVIDLVTRRAGPVNHRIHRESVRWR